MGTAICTNIKSNKQSPVQLLMQNDNEQSPFWVSDNIFVHENVTYLTLIDLFCQLGNFETRVIIVNYFIPYRNSESKMNNCRTSRTKVIKIFLHFSSSSSI